MHERFASLKQRVSAQTSLFLLTTLPLLLYVAIRHTEMNGTAIVVSILICVFAVLLGMYGPHVTWILIAIAGIAMIARIPLPDYASIPIVAGIAYLAAASFRRGIVAGVALLTLNCLADWINTGRVDYTRAQSVLAAICVALLIEEVWHRQLDNSEREHQRELQRQHARNTRIASQLHNSVCNDLVYISYVAQDTAQSSNEEIARVAQDALEKTRTAIQLLDGATSTGSRPSTDDNDTRRPCPTSDDAGNAVHLSRLETRCRQYDRQLRELGFRGASSIHHATGCVLSEQQADLINELIPELYGNIMKYGDPQRGYFLHITVDDHVVITAVNGIGGASTHPQVASLHTGLKRIRQQISDAKGDFEVQHTDSQWVVRIRIPNTRIETSATVAR